MNKYLKVMFGTKGANYEYKIDEVNVANVWNPKAKSGKDFGGFNFSTEEKILRWLHRGNTLYDVILPEDTEVIDCVESATPHGVFRSNKIIITNPRKVTDEMALYFYEKSTIPEIAYYKALGAVSLMNYKKTALQIFSDKINEKNIDKVLEEWNDFMNNGGDGNRLDSNETVVLISKKLNDLKAKKK